MATGEGFHGARSEAIAKFTKEVRTLSIDGAIGLREIGMQISQVKGVPGFLAVYDASGMEQTTQVIGSATTLNVEIARAKIQTVLAVHRSSRLQRERMIENGQTSADFGGQLGSLFGGGIAIFADEAKTEFVGAMAFSGGTQEQDEEICRKTVEEIGLYTDVTQIPTE